MNGAGGGGAAGAEGMHGASVGTLLLGGRGGGAGMRNVGGTGGSGGSGGSSHLGTELLHIWPSYLAYAVSFVTIGIMWVNHHWVMSQIDHTDRRFLFGVKLGL